MNNLNHLSKGTFHNSSIPSSLFFKLEHFQRVVSTGGEPLSVNWIAGELRRTINLVENLLSINPENSDLRKLRSDFYEVDRKYAVLTSSPPFSCSLEEEKISGKKMLLKTIMTRAAF